MCVDWIDFVPLQVVNLGCNDKIAQVFTSTVQLLKSLSNAMEKEHERSLKHAAHSSAEKVGIGHIYWL